MKKILFIDGTLGFSPHRLEEKPCGGILTSLTLIPRYLQKAGYDVTVYSDYSVDQETAKGVLYVNKLEGDGNPDLVICNRSMINNQVIEMYGCPKIWWLHDITQFSYLVDGGYKRVDKIIALSQYCKDSYSNFYDIPEDKFVIIPNGVDKNMFYKDDTKRNKNLFICASAPIKGLKPIETTYTNLVRHNPDVELRLYCSQRLHDMEDSAGMKLLFDKYRTLGIKVLDPIPQKELAQVMREARGLLMPNHYPEICSNLILQAQACGCPVVTTPIGSALEFVEHGKTGLLTMTYPHDMNWFYKDYAVNVINLMQDDELFNAISNSDNNVSSWEEIGDKWKGMIKEII